MRRRASSISRTSSSGSSSQTSKNNSPQTTPSICPICHKSSIYETVVMWKECKHTMVSVPLFIIIILEKTRTPFFLILMGQLLLNH